MFITGEMLSLRCSSLRKVLVNLHSSSLLNGIAKSVCVFVCLFVLLLYVPSQ